MKPTQILFGTKRFRLLTKRVNKGYYKGTRGGSAGRHTKHGNYIIEWSKVRDYIVPEGLSKFLLSPFVTNRMKPTRGVFSGNNQGGVSAPLYLQRWKAENGKY